MVRRQISSFLGFVGFRPFLKSSEFSRLWKPVESGGTVRLSRTTKSSTVSERCLEELSPNRGTISAKIRAPRGRKLASGTAWHLERCLDGLARVSQAQLLVSLGFKWYVSAFANYQRTDGAIGGAIGALLWLYVLGLAILMGAELNAVIEHVSPVRKDSGEKTPGGRIG